VEFDEKSRGGRAGVEGKRKKGKDAHSLHIFPRVARVKKRGRSPETMPGEVLELLAAVRLTNKRKIKEEGKKKGTKNTTKNQTHTPKKKKKKHKNTPKQKTTPQKKGVGLGGVRKGKGGRGREGGRGGGGRKRS